MSGARALPMWLFGAVALVIALTAFGLAQLAPGLGMPFVLIASMFWVSYSVARGRGMGRR